MTTYANALATTANDSRMDPNRGSAYRYVRDMYAYMVTLSLTGGKDVCPCCGIAITPETVECDRVNPDKGYSPSNIVAVCAGKYGCNQQRAIAQTNGSDWANVAAYAADVARASESVTVPAGNVAKAWWKASRQGTARVSRYA